MIAQLFPRTDDDPFLHPKEVAERITSHFPNSKADWNRANRKLQAELERLEQLGTPTPIIAGHKNLFNNTAYIEVRPSNTPDSGVWFFAYVDSAIDVELNEADGGGDAVQERQLAAEIAKCLNYDVEFHE